MRQDREAKRPRNLFSCLRECPRAAILAAALLVSTSCAGSLGINAEPVGLRISGSTSMEPLIEELTQAYRTAHPNVIFEVSLGDSATGLQDLRAGEADLAGASWKEERDSIVRGLQAVPIARDGLAIIVHPSNRVPDLTLLQLRALYRGETLDWSALGGPAAEPVIISREDGSGDRQAFEALVMGEDRVTFNALVMPTAAAVIDYVTRHPAAIGYVSLAQVRDDVRALPIEGVIPSPEQVRTGAYHLSRLLFVYVNDPPFPEVRGFLDFVLSPDGQAIVARHHAPLK